MDQEEVLAIVREEITRTLNALSLAAHELDGYDTPELDTRAYQAGREVSQRAVANLNVCWTEGHSFTSSWSGRPVPACIRCGEPVNPFEAHEHTYDVSEGEPTDCIECGAPYPKKDRTND